MTLNHLSVTVRFLGRVVEQRTLRLREGLRFGEQTGAVVGFPHATLRLGRDALGWTLGGHRLVAGRPLVLSYGEFEVCFEGVVEQPARRSGDHPPDPRLLVAALAIVLAAAWVDTVERVVVRHPTLVSELSARLLAAEVPTAREEPLHDTGEGWEHDWPPAERTVALE